MASAFLIHLSIPASLAPINAVFFLSLLSYYSRLYPACLLPLHCITLTAMFFNLPLFIQHLCHSAPFIFFLWAPPCPYSFFVLFKRTHKVFCLINVSYRHPSLTALNSISSICSRAISARRALICWLDLSWFTTTLFLMFRARLAYFSVFSVSMKSRSDGLTQAIINVRLV